MKYDKALAAGDDALDDARYSRLSDVKEMLREQLELAHGGCIKFAKDLGMEEQDIEYLSGEQLNADLEIWLRHAESIGSLDYYQQWLDENPGETITLAAFPNWGIHSSQLDDAGRAFAQQQPSSNLESCRGIIGSVENFPTYDNIEANFVIFTSKPNLPVADTSSQLDTLHEIQSSGTPGGAHIPQLTEWLAMCYRLREESSDGILHGEGTRDKTGAVFIEREFDHDFGWFDYKPAFVVNDDGTVGYNVGFRFMDTDKQLAYMNDDGRFVTGAEIYAYNIRPRRIIPPEPEMRTQTKERHRGGPPVFDGVSVIAGMNAAMQAQRPTTIKTVTTRPTPR
jgi:hypothetical protein